MDTYDNAGDDQFHTLIHSASPRVAEDDEHTRRLLREVADSVRGATSERPRRRIKVVAAIVAPLLVLGSASAAYAATGGWSWYWDMSKSQANAGEVEPWLPAAQNPDARVTYSLPGGGTCELRLWGFTFSPQADAPEGVAFDPRSAELARDFAASADIAALMDVPSVIAENRSDENWGPDENGLLTRYGYGTDRYDEDVEYHSAAQEAINDVIVGHLDSLGVPSNGMGWEGQEICAGVDE